MNTLISNGIDRIFHVTPLHYLPYIARNKFLKSKVTLRNEGFIETHFRTKSKNIDVKRGFGDYIHLSTVAHPPILAAKLEAGFPHICLSICSASLDGLEFDLCRYNVAMSRQLRRAGSTGFKERPENGYYYGNLQIPVARTPVEHHQLIQARRGKMLEVLVKSPISLPDDTCVSVFCADDRESAANILEKLNSTWGVSQTNGLGYAALPEYSRSINQFIDTALEDRDWKGNGLEFDRV